ncbi:MAG: phosphoesterase, partial [Paraburkholderia fungorum]|nr:phosphoesterase [Paraburkholderia fungorum]
MSQRSGLRAFFMVVCAALAGLIVAACGSSSSSIAPTGQQQIRHVFVITLENENYATTFGASSKAPYLSQTLASQG